MLSFDSSCLLPSGQVVDCRLNNDEVVSHHSDTRVAIATQQASGVASLVTVVYAQREAFFRRIQTYRAQAVLFVKFGNMSLRRKSVVSKDSFLLPVISAVGGLISIDPFSVLRLVFSLFGLSGRQAFPNSSANPFPHLLFPKDRYFSGASSTPGPLCVDMDLGESMFDIELSGAPPSPFAGLIHLDGVRPTTTTDGVTVLNVDFRQEVPDMGILSAAVRMPSDVRDRHVFDPTPGRDVPGRDGGYLSAPAVAASVGDLTVRIAA